MCCLRKQWEQRGDPLTHTDPVPVSFPRQKLLHQVWCVKLGELPLFALHRTKGLSDINGGRKLAKPLWKISWHCSSSCMHRTPVSRKFHSRELCTQVHWKLLALPLFKAVGWQHGTSYHCLLVEMQPSPANRDLGRHSTALHIGPQRANFIHKMLVS